MVGAGPFALALLVAGGAEIAACPSETLRAFSASASRAAESRVFEAEQVIVTKGACVRRGAQRDAWFALGDDGGAALRGRYCGGGLRRALVHNGTKGATFGGLKAPSAVFKAVAPYAAATSSGGTRWRLYKRCGPLQRNGRPGASEHLELLPATPDQAMLAETARWVDGPVVLASDWLSNVGHAVRDVLLLAALSREWCGRDAPRYALLRQRRPAPWVSDFFAAVASAEDVDRFDPPEGSVTCVRGGVIQKAAQHVGDAEDARAARRAALLACGVDETKRPTSLVYVVHGASRQGGRAVANGGALQGALESIAGAQNLRLRVVELGNRSFCDQVSLVYDAKVLVGVFGAAVGGNAVLTHDAATTIELTACGHSKPSARPVSANLGHSFQPLAANFAKGYVVFCLCVDDDATDLGAKRTTTRGGWFRSDRLLVNAAALVETARRVDEGDFRAASLAAAEGPCAALRR